MGSGRVLRSRAERSESPNRLRTEARGGSEVSPGSGAEPRSLQEMGQLSNWAECNSGCFLFLQVATAKRKRSLTGSSDPDAQCQSSASWFKRAREPSGLSVSSICLTTTDR